MKLIVGLGNPGERYEQTRHNIGFMALDLLAARYQCNLKDGHKSQYGKVSIKGEDVILQKPMTYMNLSGEAVQSLAAYFKIQPADILVLHDELEFPFESIRLKVGGGDGGHNGLKSITSSLGTNNYSRIRIGVGRPPHPAMDVADYVLSQFSSAERSKIEDVCIRTMEAVDAFIENKFQRLMNSFNRKENS